MNALQDRLDTRDELCSPEARQSPGRAAEIVTVTT